MTATWFTTADPPEAVAAELERVGVAFIADLVTGDDLDELRTELQRILAESPRGEHEYLGLETRRTGRLFAKTRAADAVATDPFVLDVLGDLLGEFQLNAPSGIELLPGEVEGHWHNDDTFYPLRRPHPDVVCNVLVAVDEFTTANGATRIAVGSNRWAEPRDPTGADPIVVAEMPAGGAALFTGTTTHSAGANRTGQSRIALALEYAAAWLRPQETLTLSVPPDIVATLPPRLRELLGYNVTATGLGHVGGEPPTVVLEEATRP